MAYIGNPIYQSAFVTDSFSGTGSQTAYTMSVAPAGTSNVLVVVSGVLQDPSTYGVVGTTLTFSAAPPSGTGNISCRYLGVPVTGVVTTAYRTLTEFTATAGQTTFTPPSYTVGFINVYRNGVLLGSADYTASNGTTVVLATGAAVGNLVTVESFLVSSVLNAIPNTAGSVSSSNIQTSPTLTTPTIDKINTSVANTSLGAGNASMLKNRLINGAMVIDQRNAGAAVTTDGFYPVDRFRMSIATGSQSAQRSTTATNGFINSLALTIVTGAAPSVSSQNSIRHIVEGFNVSDLGWGTANAKTVTLSFWVRSSVTGTFSGSLMNGAYNRSYVFNYSIALANTWTQATVTIVGDTSGTWLTDNSAGIRLNFDTGTGTNYNGTVSAWSAGEYYRGSGAVQLVATTGATFYITGVQLEVGSSATGFEYRQYGQELALCQRYYQFIGGVAAGFPIVQGYATGGTNYSMPMSFPVTMRVTPTATVLGTWSVSNSSQPAVAFSSQYGASLRAVATALGGCFFYPDTTDDLITFSAEL